MRSSVVRPIAVYARAVRRGFFQEDSARFTVARRQTLRLPCICYIGPLPTWHVERSRKSPKWLVAFVAAISCLARIDDVFRSDPRERKTLKSSGSLDLNDKVERLATRVLFIRRKFRALNLFLLELCSSEFTTVEIESLQR